MPSPVSIIAAPEAEREPNARAAEAIRSSRAHGRGGGITLHAPSGGRVELPLTESALEAIEAVLERLGTHADVVVGQREREVSPEEAAKLLGVSRPLVYHRMDTGRLPFRQVGSHRRVLFADVLALKAAEDEKRAAARAFGEDTDDQDAPVDGP